MTDEPKAKQGMSPERVATLYKEGLTLSQLGRKYHRPVAAIRKVLVSQGVKIRNNIEASSHYIPTPEQIENAKREIQTGWSLEQEKARMVGDTDPMTVTVVQTGSKRRNGDVLC